MVAPNADSARNVVRYTGQNYTFVAGYFRNRDPATHDLRDPRNQGYYPTPSLWINKTNMNLWALVRIANNLATWVLLNSGGIGTTLSLSDTAGTKTFPDITGNIQLKSSDASISIIAGVNNLDLTLPGGGQAVQKFTVDHFTAPATSTTVIPVAGNITLNGLQVANDGIPVDTRTIAAGQIQVEVQQAGSQSSVGPITSVNGLASFNSAQFAVTNGFVSLTGGGGTTPAIINVGLNNGTTPIAANGSGLITLLGGTIANTGTSSTAVQTSGTSSNAAAINLQFAGSNPAVFTPNNFGVAQFNSNQFNVSGGFVSLTGISTLGTTNLGIAYAAGTFTVLSANGTNLSASNPGYVTMPDRANPGRLRTFTITANQSFTDATGANSLGNNLFGLVTNIASFQLPFYIYFGADNADSNGTFFISRVPHRSICPLAANIAQAGNTNATTQGSFFALQAITPANFDSQPCIVIGAYRMVYSSAAAPWSVVALSDGFVNANQNMLADGIGQFHDGSKFQVGTGQFGSAAGSYFSNNGGTAPTWSIQAMDIELSKNGKLLMNFKGTTSTSGAGSVVALLNTPYTLNQTGGIGSFYQTGAVGTVLAQDSLNSVLMNVAGGSITNVNLAVAALNTGFNSYIQVI